jgi:hypothetical protein
VRASFFWTGFEAVEDAGGLTFTEPSLGLEHRVNGTGTTDAQGVLPFASRTIQVPGILRPIPAVLSLEARYVRHGPDVVPPKLLGSADVIPKDSSNDWHDDSRGSHETGGARRRFASVALARAFAGKADGVLSVRSFARDQEPRPVGHALARGWKYSAYYGVPPDGWKYDEHQADGWSVFDPAHLECTALFAGTALGDALCFSHLASLATYVFQTFPGGGAHGVAKGWRGSDQERAVGEVVGFATRCALVGLGMGPACTEFRDRFLGGLDPKQHLLGYLNDLVARPPPFGVPGHVDVNNLASIGTYHGRPELVGAYGWQNAILHYWVEYALASGLVNDPLRAQTIAWLRPRCDEFVRRAVAPSGVAYGFTSAADFGADAVLLAQAAEKRPGFRYEQAYVNGDGQGPLRLAPRVADSELTAAALAANPGYRAAALSLNALHPTPGDSDAYAKVATYLEPLHALLGA